MSESKNERVGEYRQGAAPEAAKAGVGVTDRAGIEEAAEASRTFPRTRQPPDHAERQAMTLKAIYLALIGIAEQADALAARHDQGAAVLPQRISATALRDFACHVENAIKAISPATLQAIAYR